MDEEKKEPEAPRWEQRTELKVNAKMSEVLLATIAASKKEVAALRRKRDKLMYGS